MTFQTKLSPDPRHVKLKLLLAIKLLRQGQTNKKAYAEAFDFLLKTLNEDQTDEQYFM
ncbi:hypothetical protein [Spirosoma lituiforme]